MNKNRDIATKPIEKESTNSTKSFQAGDWYCTDCHTLNFARRSDCFKCRTSKPEGTDDAVVKTKEIMRGTGPNRSFGAKTEGFSPYKHQYPPNTQLRRGDWGCPNEDCRAANFASRKNCFQCETERPPQPNEWTCPECDFQNKDFRVECFKCACRNPAPPGKGLREGDWSCSCGHYNFAKRSDCQQCHKKKA